ncbi:MAG: hypothetical protein CO186_00685 [Zetaproteobacteria bacterium CG_4_9_14_3_um_filter_49_83]|nr:MAG: hypothetical protein AUJ56_11530 [Zetaproteobacteria bacterium CG1_02_49_23]PIQ31807.1 MAG: hypothetical protein COW62_08805 [Zetaproteobacteria bacterium CG17_big_fil_post_rev_8_21_14_2_50_50_13]PIV30269.1 MAG: hypothetical protein COS35_07620 [Zetaproteobacteria bacterium CG02_land_8_20_14_3_00_50_9]PIY56170.1 MAG: hypothetical protein COZ00_05645 [Zetaproteobacteria bacterium CG_4_10_14_0_8_um_filter_49_80]PJA36448.1 MAG: hypothetical protein CO186_00685 [Zetaproteobacteria bacterium
MDKHLPQNINDEASYQETLAILSKQSKPSRVLCVLMNMLESYRQARKMGWSRPWNKYGLTTFQSFKIDPEADGLLCDRALGVVKQLEQVPDQVSEFVNELFGAQGCLMGFLFFSEYTEDHLEFETATLSFGRKVIGNTRFRDRFDVVFDAPVQDGCAQRLSRVRLYSDPYADGSKELLWTMTFTEEIPESLQALFYLLCDYSWQWQLREDKHWDHWTSRYIDYFGPRQHELKQSHFYQASGQRFIVDTACTM